MRGIGESLVPEKLPSRNPRRWMRSTSRDHYATILAYHHATLGDRRCS